MLPSLDHLVRSPYFNTYLNHLATDNLLSELNHSRLNLVEILENLEDAKLDFRYAEGKWTIKELVHHIIDTELIFNYRALRIAREDEAQILPGFEENQYVAATDLSDFTKAEIIDYLNVVRQSTIYLLKSFNAGQLKKIGQASGWDIQVHALFYITAGHTIHHTKVLKERYL